ncbi:MAG TPA: helix-turn-helix transcriptional regulator [Stellaceae bacterium]
MSIAADADARSIDPDDYQDVPRPVAAMAKTFPSGTSVAPHRHRRAQLVFATSGVMRVTAPAGGAWIVPPQRAVWVPAGTEHAIRMSGEVAMRTLYVAPDAAEGLPRACAVIEVSPLLRELILAALAEPVEYDEDGRAGLIVRLILHELRAIAAVPALHLPWPERDRRLLAVCRGLADDPACPDTIDAWGERVGASGRTLARLFQNELGMSFLAWRRQFRLAEALSRLAGGAPVAQVARDLGYAGPSAFTAMFRRTLGAAPGEYMPRVRPDAGSDALSAPTGGRAWDQPAS